MNIKFLSALFAAFLLAGCAAPVRYIETSTTTKYEKVCDAAGECQFVAVAAQSATTPTTTVVTTTPAPSVVYVQAQPTVYINPVLGIVAGAVILHEIFGGRHHRR